MDKLQRQRVWVTRSVRGSARSARHWRNPVAPAAGPTIICLPTPCLTPCCRQSAMPRAEGSSSVAIVSSSKTQSWSADALGQESRGNRRTARPMRISRISPSNANNRGLSPISRRFRRVRLLQQTRKVRNLSCRMPIEIFPGGRLYSERGRLRWIRPRYP